MSMKRSLARMVTTAMHNQHRLKQQPKTGSARGPESAISEKNTRVTAAGGEPVSAELAAGPSCPSGPRVRFSPPPVDIVS